MNEKLSSVVKTICDVQNNNFLKEENDFLRKEIAYTNNILNFLIKDNQLNKGKYIRNNHEKEIEYMRKYELINNNRQSCKCGIQFCNNMLIYDDIESYNIVNYRNCHSNLQDFRYSKDSDVWRTICNDCHVKLIKNDINIINVDEFTYEEWDILENLQVYTRDNYDFYKNYNNMNKILLDKKLRYDENNKLKKLLSDVLENKLTDNEIVIELFKTIDFYQENMVS